MFHRVRADDGLAGAVDVYEVLSLDGKVKETLFLSMYGVRPNSPSAPGNSSLLRPPAIEEQYGSGTVLFCSSSLSRSFMRLFKISSTSGGNGWRTDPGMLASQSDLMAFILPAPTVASFTQRMVF
jgi:hypothetical protein